VRVTADCPFVNAELVDYCIERAAAWGSFDLATTKTRFPAGLDAEIYRAGSMDMQHRRGQLTAAEREHLTLHYYNHPGTYDIRYVEPMVPWPTPGSHFMVDTSTDYARALNIAAALPEGDMSLDAVVQVARRYMSNEDSATIREEP
jgi:spore coat polysaccharide biosynthesis protein SpsF